MQINGKEIRITNYSLEHLKLLNDTVEHFMFAEAPLFMKGEPYAPTYKKDKKHFKALISAMVAFKRDLMTYFTQQYNTRYALIKYPALRWDEGDDQILDDTFYDEAWDDDASTLSQVIEKNTKKTYGLGIAWFLLFAALKTQHDATDAKAQSYLLDNATKMADFINQTTQDRVKAAIQTSLELGETRTQFDNRLRDIFINPYRGRFIAQHESLKTYLDAKHNAAGDAGMTKKTWIGPQAIDKICGDVNGETVDINEQFSNGLDGPLAHYGCRCDLSYS